MNQKIIAGLDFAGRMTAVLRIACLFEMECRQAEITPSFFTPILRIGSQV